MKNKNFFTSIVAILSGRSVTLLIGFVFTPVIVRILGQQEYGVYAGIMAAYGIISLVSSLGLFDSMRKNVAKYDNDTDSQFGILASGVILAATYSFTSILLIFAISSYFTTPLLQYRKYIPIICVAIFGNNIYMILRGYFYAQYEERLSERVRVLRQTVFVILSTTLAIVGLGVGGVMIGFVAGMYISVMVYGFVLFRDQYQRVSSFISAKTLNIEPNTNLRKVARFGGISAIGGVAATILLKLDILLVAHFMSPSDVAAYRAALLPTEYIWFVPSVIAAAQLHRVSDYWSNDHQDKINKLVESSIKYAFLGLVLLGVGLFGLSGDFLTLYFGTEYTDANIPLQILLFGAFAFGIVRVINPVLQATEWLVYTESITFLSLIINIALNIILIPSMGIVGAAVATTFSYSAVLLGNLLIWTRTQFTLISRYEGVRLLATFSIFSVIYIPSTYFSPFKPVVNILLFPVLGFTLLFTIASGLGLLPTNRLVQFILRN